MRLFREKDVFSPIIINEEINKDYERISRKDCYFGS